MIGTGLDRLLEDAGELRGRRYALLGHAASVTADLVPAHIALTRQSEGKLALLLGPEHGFYGIEQDMVPSVDAVDPWTGVPVRSLYGDCRESLQPDPELFSGVDLLLIDLQDVGCRFYTFGATAVWTAEAALAAGSEVWVLDRPNPLGGMEVEGNLLQAGFESFVGAFRLPVRHGLTLGELMRLESVRRGWSAGLRVVPMVGWSRVMTWKSTGRPWLAPSPNMPTSDTTWVYPGSCLLEATTLSEGRGTTAPFQFVGAPGLDPVALAARLSEVPLQGVSFVPTYFRPQFQKWSGEECGGVQIRVTHEVGLKPYRVGIELLLAIDDLLPDGVEWRQEAYEFVRDRPAIDLLTGDRHLREALAGQGDLMAWLSTWKDDEEAFREERQESLLYPEAEIVRDRPPTIP